MLFSFECPTCGGKLEADSSLSRAQAACPQCGKPVAVPDARVEVGTVIGGFRIERLLGKGGMGEVFLAHQISVDRRVAVKVLPPGFADDEAAVQRFLQEGKLAAGLDHENIATVHEAGEDSGNYYLAMAYVDGESLDRRLGSEGVLPETEALRIARAVAEALAYAWETAHILHRDIKPANIMVDTRQRIFLMDLGLAKSLGQKSGVTLSGTVLGTPRYMSPEQARGQTDLGVASDIYSLGATLYHLVTGAPPFDGDSVPVLLHQHVYEPLPPPRKRNPNLTAGCARLIERAMAKEPENRYGGWRELVADLDRALACDGPVAQDEGSWEEPLTLAPAQSASRSQRSLARQAQESLARQRQSHVGSAASRTTSAVAPSSLSRRLRWLLAVACGTVLVVLVVLVTRGRGNTVGERTETPHVTSGPAAMPGPMSTDSARRSQRPEGMDPALVAEGAARGGRTRAAMEPDAGSAPPLGNIGIPAARQGIWVQDIDATVNLAMQRIADAGQSVTSQVEQSMRRHYGRDGWTETRQLGGNTVVRLVSFQGAKWMEQWSLQVREASEQTVRAKILSFRAEILSGSNQESVAFLERMLPGNEVQITFSNGAMWFEFFRFRMDGVFRKQLPPAGG